MNRRKLNISIFGAGTYGSYIANAVATTYPCCSISMFDVGNESIKSENEIGFKSNNRLKRYNAATEGRYFGLGGTSAKWGGQLLFFSSFDCPEDPTMENIKNINIKYKNSVLKRFFKSIPDVNDRQVQNALHIKLGIWLKFNARNVFEYFKLNSIKQINIIKNTRLIRINREGNNVTSVVILQDGLEQIVISDVYYITCGALETMRILAVSNLFDLEKITTGFSDHVSLRCFRIFSKKTILLGNDMSFGFYKNSLITSRIIGEVDGVAFYAHPIYNEKFRIFQVLKNIIFKGKISIMDLLTSFGQIFYIFPFVWEYFINNKLYIYKSWDINIDIEIDRSKNCLRMNSVNDLFNQRGIEIDYSLPDQTIDQLQKAKMKIRSILLEEKVDFEELSTTIATEKLEDTYHPYKLYNDGSTLNRRFNPLSNLYVCHTGLLNRAGGLNPTAVLFCLIENHVSEELNKIIEI